MSDFSIRPLSSDTWPAFAALVEAHHGVWGGCWCVEFHPDGKPRGPHRRALKEQKVREGTTHAALVFDGARCVGWCQFGPPDELPRIKHLKVYQSGAGAPPDWRITCFFVDPAYRGQGVASTALAGALGLIATMGGGTVESYPEDVAGRQVAGALLHNSRLAMFEHQGFVRGRQIGKHHWVVSRHVAPAAPTPAMLPRVAGRVRLRRLRVADLADFQAYRGDPVLGIYQGWVPMTDAKALEFLREIAGAPLLQPGQWSQIAIADPGSDRLLGDIGIFIAEGHAHAEIGFTLARPVHGGGLAAQAVAGAIGMIFAHRPVPRVIGVTDARNAASCRLLARVGMVRVSTADAVFRGEPCVEHTYAIVRPPSADPALPHGDPWPAGRPLSSCGPPDTRVDPP